MGLGNLDLVLQWGSQALRKCILGWVRGLRSSRYIRNILEKISKNQVGGGSKVTLDPPHLDVRKRQQRRGVDEKFSNGRFTQK